MKNKTLTMSYQMLLQYLIKMHRNQQHNLVLFVAITLLCASQTDSFLLYPNSTVLQFTSTLSIPIELVVPDRKLFMDLGFQQNYAMPFLPSSFYASPIWADQFSRGKRNIHNNYYNSNDNNYSINYNNNQMIQQHANDFTAGELYLAIENLLEDFGFHSSCLQRSVCELARHPFENDHDFGVVTQIMTLLLTPSIHQGFAASETKYQHRFERAERIGIMGGYCHQMYPDCDLDLLTKMTRLIS